MGDGVAVAFGVGVAVTLEELLALLATEAVEVGSGASVADGGSLEFFFTESVTGVVLDARGLKPELEEPLPLPFLESAEDEEEPYAEDCAAETLETA